MHTYTHTQTLTLDHEREAAVLAGAHSIQLQLELALVVGVQRAVPMPAALHVRQRRRRRSRRSRRRSRRSGGVRVGLLLVVRRGGHGGAVRRHQCRIAARERGGRLGNRLLIGENRIGRRHQQQAVRYRGGSGGRRCRRQHRGVQGARELLRAVPR